MRELDGLDRLLEGERERRRGTHRVVDMAPERALAMERPFRERDGNLLHRHVLVHVHYLRRAHGRASAREREVGVDYREDALGRARKDLESPARAAYDERGNPVVGKHSAIELEVRRHRAARPEVNVRAVLGVAERSDALQLAPHLDRRKRQESQRLQDEVGHRIVRGAAAKPLHRLPIVTSDKVLAPDADLVYVAEPCV